jgi:UDP-GlcNAc:undecaprenyl-phosphate GlcNAc-1-phosphate transferase
VGALASFLIFNKPPAKIYMGNSGSHLVGFILAAVAPLISYAPMEHAMALATPILILGLPVFDTAFLMLMRMQKGRNVFLKSDDHLALRFLKKGYSKVRALSVMLTLGVYFALSGIFLTQAPKVSAAVVIIVAGVIGLCFITDMRKVLIDG